MPSFSSFHLPTDWEVPISQVRALHLEIKATHVEERRFFPADLDHILCAVIMHNKEINICLNQRTKQNKAPKTGTGMNVVSGATLPGSTSNSTACYLGKLFKGLSVLVYAFKMDIISFLLLGCCEH